MATNIALLLLFLATSSFRCALAQPSTGPDDYGTRYRYNTHFSPGIAILVVFLVAFFFVIIFFSLYISRRAVVASAVAPVPTAAAARGGLDPAILEKFPTLAYAEVMELKSDREPLECAVCLCEFSEDESLRMLPRCCHVFHPDCIGGWLAGHKTCPVCRADLSAAAAAPEEPPVADVAIDLSKIGRSNTIAVADRFTLRIPEHVRREIVMKRSASVAVAFPAKGEASSRSGYRRGRSDRWGSLVRTLSIWRTGDGEGSTSSDSRKERIFEFLAGHKRRSSSKGGSDDHPSSSAPGPDAHV